MKCAALERSFWLCEDCSRPICETCQTANREYYLYQGLGNQGVMLNISKPSLACPAKAEQQSDALTQIVKRQF